MHKYENIGIIPEKEKDTAFRILFLKSFLKVYASLAMPLIGAMAIVLEGPLLNIILTGLLLDMILSPVVCAFVFFAINKSADGFMAAFGQRKPLVSLREQLSGSLKAVKVAKMNKDFKKALELVNQILEQDPEFYEAMLVKAQILNEGFNNPENAKRYLAIILENTDEKESVHSWASSFNQEI